MRDGYGNFPEVICQTHYTDYYGSMPRESRVLYRFLGGNLALDFANTIHTFDLADQRDEWHSAEDVITWAARAGVLTRSDARALGSETSVLERARRWRHIIYDVFVALTEGGRVPRHALARFNDAFGEAMGRSRVVRANGRYVLEPLAAPDPLTRLRDAIGRAATELLTSPEAARVRQCADAYCSWLFLDLSRNGSRRWCTMDWCGNRARVRAFRRRARRDSL